MKLSDFKGVFNKTEVEFISATNVEKDYYEIRLQMPKGLTWRPGEHGIFSLPTKKVEGKKWRAFSIASTPKENVILLGTRTGKNISSFKKELINLEPGEKVQLRGPFGWFTDQDKTKPVVLIALGVGVTPARALLTSFEHQHDRTVEFVYSSLDTYLFKDRIEEIINHNDTFTSSYVSSIQETKAKIKEKIDQYGNDAYYYVSGSNEAIKSIKALLKDNGIKGKKIINDPFLGY